MNNKDFKYLETVRGALMELTAIDDIKFLKEEIIGIAQSIMFKTINYASKHSIKTDL